MKNVKRGEIYYADLSPLLAANRTDTSGPDPAKRCREPVQSTTIVAPITSVQKKQAQPTHIVIDCEFLESKSTILLEQIRTIDKTRLSDYLGQLSMKIFCKSIRPWRSALA